MFEYGIDDFGFSLLFTEEEFWSCIWIGIIEVIECLEAIIRNLFKIE